jgi:hypothetical protein
VVYQADQDIDQTFDLYCVGINGGVVAKLTDLPAASKVLKYQVTAGSQWLVFLADQDVFDKYELYLIPLTGGSTTKMSGGLVANGDVNSFHHSPPGWFTWQTRRLTTNLSCILAFNGILSSKVNRPSTMTDVQEYIIGTHGR